MKVLVLIALATAFIVLSSYAGPQQNRSDTQTAGLKHLETTLPSGEPVRFTAAYITRTWGTGVVHFKGNVKAEIRESIKAGDRYIAIHADGLDYYEKTGNLIPSGNVSVAQESL